MDPGFKAFLKQQVFEYFQLPHLFSNVLKSNSSKYFGDVAGLKL